MNDALWACAKRVGISWAALIAILLLWGMIYGAYTRNMEDWRAFACIAVLFTWLLLLDMVETMKMIYHTVKDYAERNQKP